MERLAYTVHWALNAITFPYKREAEKGSTHTHTHAEEDVTMQQRWL